MKKNSKIIRHTSKHHSRFFLKIKKSELKKMLKYDYQWLYVNHCTAVSVDTLVESPHEFQVSIDGISSNFISITHNVIPKPKLTPGTAFKKLYNSSFDKYHSS